MSGTSPVLRGFAYGEQIEQPDGRSLGYRLLVPVEPEPWCAEVEALARQLQATPYPEHWPATELFCSVLLADGRRLVAVARYGLCDHTSSKRCGGFELIGVVASETLAAPAALAVYRWLRQRRATAGDISGPFSLDEVQASAPPAAVVEPVPVLPVRLWQDGVLLFAATTAAEPDRRLGLLEQDAGTHWEWLPLVGADFPVQEYARRGPLVAWTPNLAGVAVKLDARPADGALPPALPRATHMDIPALVLLFVLVSLLSGNLWAMLSLRNRISSLQANAPAADAQALPPAHNPDQPSTAGARPEGSRDRFAAALHDLLMEPASAREWEQLQPQLLARYERLVRDHKELRLKESDTNGKLAVGAISVLAHRSAGQVEDAVRKALSKKGYDPDLIKVACDRIHEQLLTEVRDNP